MEINRQGAIIIPAEDLYEWLEEHSGKFVQGGNIVKSEDVLWLADRPGVCQFKLVAVDSTEQGETITDPDPGTDDSSDNS